MCGVHDWLLSRIHTRTHRPTPFSTQPCVCNPVTASSVAEPTHMEPVSRITPTTTRLIFTVMELCCGAFIAALTAITRACADDLFGSRVELFCERRLRATHDPTT